MSDKTHSKTLNAALGTAFAASVMFAGVAAADSTNPFQASQIDSPSNYTQVAGDSEGSCGEGNCGDKKEEKKDGEGSCGEGSCGEKIS